MTLKSQEKAKFAQVTHQETMIPLPIRFQSGNSPHSKIHFDFKQLDRKGDVALFEKSKPNGNKSWEVVIVQKMDEQEWPGGRVTPAHEHMPHSNHWGTLGWTLQTRERVFEKFNEIANER